MSTESEKVKGALAAFVNRLLAPTIYYGSFPARVVSQNADGTLEVVPDDKRLPGLSRVPIRYGVPGVRATVRPGARVAVGFAGGDPQRPQAELWELASLIRLDIGSDGPLQPAALGNAVRAELDAVWSALASHTHSGVQTGTGASGPAVVSAAKSNVKSTTVNVKE